MSRHRLHTPPSRLRRAAASFVVAVAAVSIPLAVSFLPDSFASRPAAAAEDPALVQARAQLAYCQRLAAVGSSSAQRQRGQQCAGDAQRVINSFATTTPPTTTLPATTPPATTVPPTTTQPPTTVPTSTAPATTPPGTTPPPTTEPPTGDTLFCPPWQGPAGPFPDEHCTGWRHTGATLHDCGANDGSAIHLETAGATYVNCHFRNAVVIQAANITIRGSWIEGTVYPHDNMRTADNKPDCKGLTLIDVEVGPSSDPDRAGIGNCFNKTVLRANVHGTATGIHVSDFNSITDSYVHGFADSGSHGAAAGTGQDMGNHSTIVHNNLDCVRLNSQGVEDKTIIHCSSALSLYDEPTLTDVLVQRNLLNTVSGFCAYGGNTGTFIRFIENTFGLKYYPTPSNDHKCGPAGPITVFKTGNEGNVWTNNTYPDGTAVAPA